MTWVFLGILLAGCGSNKPTTVTCSHSEQSKTWLLGEIDQNIEHPAEGVFAFPLLNGTSRPVQLRVRSIGCSCYAVKRGSVRLKVGEQFELGAGQTETLTLHPPRPTTDRITDYQFSVEFSVTPGSPPEVIHCRGSLETIAEYRINPGVLTAEFVKGTPPQKLPLEITKTARDQQSAEEQPVVTGWPPTAKLEDLSPVGPVVELRNQLWRRGWRMEASVPCPELSSSPTDELRTIRISGKSPGSPFSQARLMVRFRSGLSGPRFVHYGDVKPGQPITRRIQILARDERPFRILGPSDTGLVLSIQPESTIPAKSHWAQLTLSPMVVGMFETSLLVETDHPEQSNIQVEVRAHIEPL